MKEVCESLGPRVTSCIDGHILSVNIRFQTPRVSAVIIVVKGFPSTKKWGKKTLQANFSNKDNSVYLQNIYNSIFLLVIKSCKRRQNSQQSLDPIGLERIRLDPCMCKTVFL